jgi:hypothetical protein
MAQNTAPIFTQTPNIGIGSIAVSNSVSPFDMISGPSSSVFTAGISGSYVSKIRIKPSGSTAATVLRFFLNNGGVTTNATNNSLYAEISIPAITVSTTLAQNDFEIPMNIAIPGSYSIYGISSAFTTGGFEITVIGGNY